MAYPSDFGHILFSLPLGSQVLDWKTPHEVLFNNPPAYDKAKPFGCLAYAANLSPYKDKFTSRSLKCVFTGYESSHKGYLLYDLESHKFFISRDVHFVTDAFPFLNPSITTPEPQIFYSGITNTEPIPIPAEPTDPQNNEQPLASDRVEILINESADDVQVLRRSSRHRTPPIWMNDYVGQVTTSTPITLSTGVAPPTFPYIINAALSK